METIGDELQSAFGDTAEVLSVTIETDESAVSPVVISSGKRLEDSRTRLLMLYIRQNDD